MKLYFCDNPDCPNRVAVSSEVFFSGKMYLRDDRNKWTVLRHEATGPSKKGKISFCSVCKRAIDLFQANMED